MNLENLEVELTGDRYSVAWELKGDRYHFWLEKETDRENAIRLVQCSYRPLYKRRPGARDVQRLNVHSVPKNLEMVNTAIAEATGRDLFAKADAERAAADKKWNDEREAERKLDLAKKAAPELLAALKLFVGDDDDSGMTFNERVTKALPVARAAIKLAEEGK